MISIHREESPHQVGKSSAGFAAKAGQMMEKHHSLALVLCASESEIISCYIIIICHFCKLQLICVDHLCRLRVNYYISATNNQIDQENANLCLNGVFSFQSIYIFNNVPRWFVHKIFHKCKFSTLAVAFPYPFQYIKLYK